MKSLRINTLALSATLHCLTGCAVGEILGLIIGVANGWSSLQTLAVATGLAFVYGYSLSASALLRHGVPLKTALKLVLAADSLSIITMELVDNAVMALVPSAMNAGLAQLIFWITMAIALLAAFIAAYPVNAYLLGRGKGHALLHRYHHPPDHHSHQEL